MDKGYKEQFKRVKRWHKRLEEIYLGMDHTCDSDYYEDVLYAFFQNCFHLKDWLIESGAINKSRVDSFIESDDDMKICRDLCTASKHLKIGHRPSIDKDIRIKNRNFSLELGTGKSKISVIYWIEAAGGVYHAFDVATRCLNLWENFLKGENLL